VRPASHLGAIHSYERALVTIAGVFERDLGFPPFPVTLEFHPDREAFEAALLESGYDPALAKNTANTMAAVGGHRQVLVNESVLVPLSWPSRVAMLAHELTHTLQYEWGGGVRGASDQWLREGFAEAISARVIERLGALPRDAMRRQKLDELRAMSRDRVPRLDEMATFPDWVEVNRRTGVAPYAYAFLAADHLIERHGTTAVVRYFELFASPGDRRQNFRTAFGEDLASFEEALLAQLAAHLR
jgi:hypothetical protein